MIGMVLGGGAGSFFLVLLAGYTPLSLDWLIGLPGVGVALGAGLFSFRRNRAWGVATALVGFALMVFVLWLRSPTTIDLPGLALRLPFTLVGALHVAIVLALGVTVGAGWEKSLEPYEDDPPGE